jgi:hypothetical protein
MSEKLFAVAVDDDPCDFAECIGVYSTRGEAEAAVKAHAGRLTGTKGAIEEAEYGLFLVAREGDGLASYVITEHELDRGGLWSSALPEGATS